MRASDATAEVVDRYAHALVFEPEYAAFAAFAGAGDTAFPSRQSVFCRAYDATAGNYGAELEPDRRILYCRASSAGATVPSRTGGATRIHLNCAASEATATIPEERVNPVARKPSYVVLDATASLIEAQRPVRVGVSCRVYPASASGMGSLRGERYVREGLMTLERHREAAIDDGP